VGQIRNAGGLTRRRGASRAVLLLAACLALFAGCGKSGQGAETDPEKGSDAELLNEALARELSILAVYTDGMRLVRRPHQAAVRRFRSHQQEYVNAITKALRGLGGEASAEPSPPDLSELEREADFLTLAYELEGAALDAYRDAAPQLYTAAPRTLALSLAAGHAQHLVVLRRALGATGVEVVPEAFDSGEEPPPAKAE
jgi:Ferritin-like domain